MMQLIKKLSEPRLLLILGVGYTLFITAAFLFPTEADSGWEIPNVDKLAHVLIYILLMLLWCSYVFQKSAADAQRNLLITALVIFGYGIVIEAIQHWLIPNRLADIWDVVANGLGSILGYLIFKKFALRIIS